jgi:hypothetical protein
MVKVNSGRWTCIWRKKKVSTAFVQNSLVALEDGFVIPADSNSGAADEQILGVYSGPAISSALATTPLIPVWVPIGPALIEATVTGTLASTSEGDGFDMSDSVTVNAGANTYKAVTCVKYLSATLGIFAISKSIYANVA